MSDPVNLGARVAELQREVTAAQQKLATAEADRDRAKAEAGDLQRQLDDLKATTVSRAALDAAAADLAGTRASLAAAEADRDNARAAFAAKFGEGPVLKDEGIEIGAPPYVTTRDSRRHPTLAAARAHLLALEVGISDARAAEILAAPSKISAMLGTGKEPVA